MQNTTISRGDLTVMAIAFALAKRGEHLLWPASENERYDLALDRGGRLYRIQCKSGHLRRGSVVFKTHSWGPRSTVRCYDRQVEAFGVYCPEIDRAFLVPAEQIAIGQKMAYLRVESRKGGCQRTVRYANDYAI